MVSPAALLPLLLFFGSFVTTTSARETPKLNSERIEARYGSYGIEVLESDPVRVSMLFSTHPEGRICRTFALVRFPEKTAPELEAPMRDILDGASLGATLKKAGWVLHKRHRYLGTITAGPRFLEMAALKRPQTPAIAIYDLHASRNRSSTIVATVLEIHHPDYLTLTDLQGMISLPEKSPDPEIPALLQLAEETMKVPTAKP